MKRIDLVYNKLSEFSSEQGIDAGTLANILNISRANVSFDLNRLWKEGKVKKTNGRPVLYSAIIPGKPHGKIKETSLDKLAENNTSLKEAIEQAKAAILYPPKGMHCLILGDTGVGKSMFADLMHSYAIEMGIKKENSPFIVFNCGDYSNNPQRLDLPQYIKEGLYNEKDNRISFRYTSARG